MTAHVHAELMKLYAQDAAETDRPQDRWQYLYGCNGWEDFVGMCGPTWQLDCKYRRKPRTHKVNGIEVPAPMRDAPAKGEKYFLPEPAESGWYMTTIWFDNNLHLERLERGLVHATKEAAVANAKAMIGVQP